MSKDRTIEVKPPRVAFLTTFYEVTSGYSLISVATTQIQMLLEHNIVPRVLVSEGEYYEDGGKPRHKPFQEQPRPSVWNQETVDLRAVLPALQLTGRPGPDFEDQVARVHAVLREHLAEVDVCIAHDIVQQEWYLPYNVALRRYAQERADLTWLHWLHSRPTPTTNEVYPYACRYTTPPGYLIFPNERDLSYVYRAYKLLGDERRVKVSRSGHALDIMKLWPFDSLTIDLVERADFLSGAVRMIYPARVDKGKQHHRLVRLAAGIHKAGYTPRVLFVDWQSSGEKFQSRKDELLALARHLEIEDCVKFTSRIDNRCNVGVPRQNVLELMMLANVFANPSEVETYGYVTHEAILFDNLCVLNFDQVPTFELFAGCGIFMDFGSPEFERTYHPTEQAFWDDQAVRLMAEMRDNRVIVAKNRALHDWTPAKLWPDFERLLYLKPLPGDDRHWEPR